MDYIPSVGQNKVNPPTLNYEKINTQDFMEMASKSLDGIAGLNNANFDMNKDGTVVDRGMFRGWITDENQLASNLEIMGGFFDKLAQDFSPIEMHYESKEIYSKLDAAKKGLETIKDSYKNTENPNTQKISHMLEKIESIKKKFEDVKLKEGSNEDKNLNELLQAGKKAEDSEGAKNYKDLKNRLISVYLTTTIDASKKVDGLDAKINQADEVNKSTLTSERNELIKQNPQLKESSTTELVEKFHDDYKKILKEKEEIIESDINEFDIIDSEHTWQPEDLAHRSNFGNFHANSLNQADKKPAFEQALNNLNALSTCQPNQKLYFDEKGEISLERGYALRKFAGNDPNRDIKNLALFANNTESLMNGVVDKIPYADLDRSIHALQGAIDGLSQLRKVYIKEEKSDNLRIIGKSTHSLKQMLDDAIARKNDYDNPSMDTTLNACTTAADAVYPDPRKTFENVKLTVLARGVFKSTTPLLTDDTKPNISLQNIVNTLRGSKLSENEKATLLACAMYADKQGTDLAKFQAILTDYRDKGLQKEDKLRQIFNLGIMPGTTIDDFIIPQQIIPAAEIPQSRGEWVGNLAGAAASGAASLGYNFTAAALSGAKTLTVDYVVPGLASATMSGLNFIAGKVVAATAPALPPPAPNAGLPAPPKNP